MKSYSFYSYKLNKDKFNTIKNYAIKVNNNKNELSKYLYQYKLDIYYGNLSKNDFVKQTKDMRNEISATTYQQVQREVYDRYITQLETFKFTLKINSKYTNTKSNSLIMKTIKYIITMNNSSKEQILDYLYIKKPELYECTNKHQDKIFKIVNMIQNRIDKEIESKLKLIEFKSLTFNDINQIGNTKEDIKMIEKTKNMKLTNAIINLNIPSIGKIEIPIKYSKKYHGNLNDYKHSINSKTKQKRYCYKLQVLDNKIRFIFAKEDKKQKKKIKVNNFNTIGVDVNTKHNLFSLSDGYTIEYDRWIIDKYKNYERYIERIQRNKEKNKIETKKYGKKVTRRIKKMNRISEAYSNYKASKLVSCCKEKDIKHIVMEDLNLHSKNKYKYKKDGVNYRNIIKVLHLNDLKNVIKRIANREGIMVSFVNPEYTSQICPCCGHISKDNRKTQETFSCVICNHKNNADINAAINIRNRILYTELRNNLMEYSKNDNMYIGKHYISKTTYINIYKNIYK